MNLKDMPRIRLGNIETPIEYLENLSKEFENNIYIKRDDLNSIGAGGNKVRKLEFIMGEALEQGADVVITSGGIQSNHVRLTMAVANKLGIKGVAVLVGEEPKEYKGNLLLNKILGSELHFVSLDSKEVIKESEKNRLLDIKGERTVRSLKEKFEEQGHKVYVIPAGGKTPAGIAGYISATLEIFQQLTKDKINADYIVTGVGTTSTIASLIIGEKLFKTGIKPIGILVTNTLGDKEKYREKIKKEIEIYLEFFSLNLDISIDDIIIFDNYTGPSYAIPSEEGVEAIKKLARTEGIFVDHIYTGKAFAGLLDLSRKGYFQDKNVLFLHTGGTPALFDLDSDLL